MATPEIPEGALFTDRQVIAATGMAVDSLRRLITWGAVRPSQSGGGRGRVRLWSTHQALRICVTSELAAEGYSLQMAHTLAYCLPLTNLMLYFDPEYSKVFARRTSADSPQKNLLKALTHSEPPKIFPGPGQYANSQVLILERRLVYSNVEEEFELVAEIDADRQRVRPLHDPEREVQGDSNDEDPPTVDKSSLLIDRRYLSARGQRRLQDDDGVIRTQKLDMIMCKSLLSLNLSLSFVLCVRRLQGFKTIFSPGYAEDEAEGQ